MTMNPCRHLWAIGLGILVLAAPIATVAKPNILFIFADDQAYDTLGPGDDPQVQTPHLDRLARQGAQFTHCFNMGSWTGAVCVASRTMLITGKTLWHAHAANQMMRNLKNQSAAEQNQFYNALWPRRMRLLGYETYFTGKWHIGVSPHHLFDHVTHIRPGMPNDSRSDRTTTVGYHRPIESQPDDWSPADPKFGGFWEGGRHWSEILADDAVGFLRSEGKRAASGSTKPFFMYLAFNAPHDPRQSPQEFLDRYPLESVKLPTPYQDKYPHNTSGLNPGLRDEALAVYPRTEYAVKVHRREYYAIISHLDEQIGRILNELQAQGLRDNTWIIYTADHGLACGHHGLMGKQNMYDHSLRPPFIIVGPKAKPGQVIGTPIFLQDLMATSLHLAGDNERNGVEFRSLLPLLEGKKETSKGVYSAYTESQRAIRHDGWKLILYPKLKVKRLYNYAADRHEQHDLAHQPAQTERMKTLFANLQRQQKKYDDTLDLAAAFPELAR
ncbi:MAG: Choline-sulfatase [Verrucomicrobia subdivision 3 bacterium]|nr:Choline-sulfatase [Limisphaerales bacterium]MCS1414110.1 Choline-sulfatase [Limisphaerales bacterium]